MFNNLTLSNKLKHTDSGIDKITVSAVTGISTIHWDLALDIFIERDNLEISQEQWTTNVF